MRVRSVAGAGVRRVLRVGAPTRPARIPPQTWRRRLDLLVTTLDPQAPAPRDDRDAETRAAAYLTAPDDATTWLALAVLSARLPTAEQVVDARRRALLDGPRAIADAARAASTRASVAREVRVLVGGTVVDMGDLVLYPLGTGIQRVARHVGRAWRDTEDFTAVGWTADMDAMVALDAAGRDRALEPDRAVEVPASSGADAPQVLVPWRSTYVLPELAIQPRRCAALQALARHSPSRCAVIGFDCVPLTSAETAATGFPAVFALNLAAVAEFDVVATISQASAVEYEGWRRMLGGAGLDGPSVVPLLLPADAPAATDEDLAEARDQLLVADLPFVLCVGSHEPRKNHLAVLHAAELLWRQGVRFSLTFVGGASWNSGEFTERLAQLRAAGRPVESVSRLSDRLLWAAYRLARCTVFPSVNEGFGLPVAESLAAGTPAITSAFGSMVEIADGGGALLVDPRDESDLAHALRRLLTDDALHATLAAAAATRRATTWDAYAADLWRVVHGSDA